MKHKIKKYYVKFSSKSDYKKITEFYNTNEHQNVRKREKEILKESIERGSVILIEDAKGNIVASSISYPVRIKDKNGILRTKWHELGSTRIILNGYSGLFDVMVTAQALRAFLVEPPEDRFVAQMHYESVQKLAENVGWRELKKVDPDLIKYKFNTVAAKDRKHASEEHWYQLGVEGMPVTSKAMVSFLDQPFLINYKTKEKIQLDFSKTEIFGIFEAPLRRLAKADFGDVNKPNLKIGVANHHRNWAYKIFK